MLIDLSVPLNKNTPVYPGDKQSEILLTAMIKNNGYENHYICISTHVGTHMDAPSHMIESGKSINALPLDKFTGRGVCIEVKNSKFDLDVIRKTRIEEGDIVFFCTSMSEKYHLPEYFTQYPAVPESIANYLVEKKVKALGVDMCSPDHAPFAVHKTLLKENIVIIENLTNLKSVLGKEFTVYAFPLNVALDGSPLRVVAEIN